MRVWNLFYRALGGRGPESDSDIRLTDRSENLASRVARVFLRLGFLERDPDLWKDRSWFVNHRWHWRFWRVLAARREFVAGIQRQREKIVGGEHRKRKDLANQARRHMTSIYARADTPRQRTFAWCPWCDLEMISAKVRWWYSEQEQVCYLHCQQCKRRSRWIFDDGHRLDPCLDRPVQR